MAFVKVGVLLNMRLLLFISLLTISVQLKAQEEYALSSVHPFNPGEEIEFKASVGFIKAAEAQLKTSEIIYQINDRATYRMDITARTTGIFDLISSVRDNWGSYFDTTSYIPQRFYRYIKEGRFRKNEVLYFDHENDSVTVAKLDKKTRKLESRKDHAITNNIQDMVSGYYYLRAIDFSKIEIGQVITIDTFFDDKIKPFKVKFMGREVIKTKLGHIKALILVPMMKKDSLFVEDNTLKVWLSDDLNKIPLKVKAKIYVGYLEVDVKRVKNLKHQLALTQQ